MGDRFNERHVYYADDWESTSGEMAVVEFQPMLDELDGFVCANDSIALGVINQLNRFGYRVPDASRSRDSTIRQSPCWRTRS